jgi:hypothetical protein
VSQADLKAADEAEEAAILEIDEKVLDIQKAALLPKRAQFSIAPVALRVNLRFLRCAQPKFVLQKVISSSIPQRAKLSTTLLAKFPFIC